MQSWNDIDIGSGSLDTIFASYLSLARIAAQRNMLQMSRTAVLQKDKDFHMNLKR